MTIECIDLGLIEYTKALELQLELVEAVSKNKSKSFLITCEHPEVITLGRAIGAVDDILDRTVRQVEVSRGGRATLHLPGQLVAYPILPLTKLDLHFVMRLLEEATIQSALLLGLKCNRVTGKTGVWVGENKKIASVGIAARNGVTYHGTSINVDCDLTRFETLNPCGFPSHVMTSFKDQGISISKDDFKAGWVKRFSSLVDGMASKDREVME